MQTTAEIIQNGTDAQLRQARNTAERHAADPNLSDDARRVADELADQLNAEIIGRRRTRNRADRSRAYETLEPGDVIFVENVRAGSGGCFWPAHYAQVMATPDGDMRTRGLLGGGAASGPLPVNRDRWWLVGHAEQGISYRPGRPSGSFTDHAARVAQRDRDRQPRPSFISLVVTLHRGEQTRAETWYDGETPGLRVRRHP